MQAQPGRRTREELECGIGGKAKERRRDERLGIEPDRGLPAAAAKEPVDAPGHWIDARAALIDGRLGGMVEGVAFRRGMEQAAEVRGWRVRSPECQ
ncbi:hypothetical protein CGK74_02015 [Thauera propionica]|uniref:Uncharacterized protein n=1 Tax=Thauera propionica TaxID=2019431 RepID=A0A235F131_9RHOO|nr:hypothetical protein CGK74_02015 [Thauera propionica]